MCSLLSHLESLQMYKHILNKTQPLGYLGIKIILVNLNERNVIYISAHTATAHFKGKADIHCKKCAILPPILPILHFLSHDILAVGNKNSGCCQVTV